MIHLNPSDSLKITTSGAEGVDVLISYTDKVGLTATHYRQAASIAAATTTVLMTAPAVTSVREGQVRPVRLVESIIVSNKDASASQTITLEVDDGDNVFRIVSFSLDAGKSYEISGNSSFLGVAPSSGGSGATDLTYTASSRVIASSTGTDATLPLMSSSNAGLVPASGGGTSNFLRADGTFAAPTGGSGDVVGPSSAVTARIATFNGTTGKLIQDGGSTIANVLDRANHTGTIPWEIQLAASDETTALTIGTAKVTFRMPWAATLTAVRASVTTAPTGSTLVVDINEAGASVLSTKLSIDASEKTSTTAATAAVISDASLADDAEITIDIDQVGSTIAGAGLKITLKGTRTP